MEAPKRNQHQQHQTNEMAQQPLCDLQPAVIQEILRERAERNEQRWQRAAVAVTANACRVS